MTRWSAITRTGGRRSALAYGSRSTTAAEDNFNRLVHHQRGRYYEGQAGDLRAELAAVKHAEERLAAGTYGFSVEGSEAIHDERLEAVPTALRTVGEQE